MGYITDLYEDNYENNLYVAIADIGIEGNHIHSGCVYSDIYDGRQNPTLRLLFAIGNIKVTDLTSDITYLLIISYCNKRQFFPLNDWKDPHYFTVAFYYLFLNCTKSHLEKRIKTMSIKT